MRPSSLALSLALSLGFAVSTALLPVAASASGGSGGSGGTGTTGGSGGGTTACNGIPVVSYSVKPGYFPGSGSTGAIWNALTVRDCTAADAVVYGRMTFTNLSTGVPYVDWCVVGTVRRSGTASCGLDREPTPLATSYRVELQLVDPAGNVLGSGPTVTVTTPLPKMQTFTPI